MRKKLETKKKLNMVELIVPTEEVEVPAPEETKKTEVPEVCKYKLPNFRTLEVDEPIFQNIKFYKLNEDGTYENGTTVEEVIKVAISRLENLNARLASSYNEKALVALVQALEALEARTQDRINRGVEGNVNEA